jgi:hypothetical protein
MQTVVERSSSRAPQGDAEAGAFDRALALAERLVASAESFALQFALPELGAIDLPPVVGSEADRAHLQTIPPLYLVSELEAARLVPAVETFAGVFASGGVQAELGPAAELLTTFWRGRRERFGQQERQAFFARLFGQTQGATLAARRGHNSSFESLMIDLTEAVSKLEAAPLSIPASEYPARAAARQLANNLVSRSGGMAAFAARDFLDTLKSALDILKEPAVQQSVGARTVWGAVRGITRQYLREPDTDIAAHVTRGKSGMLVLAWLSDVFLLLDDESRVVPPGHPVIGAALTWMQASLSIAEQATGLDGRGV